MEYLTILKAVKQMPFNVGKKLLIDFLKGFPNKSITNNRLDKKELYDSLKISKEEIEELIESLILNNLLELVPLKNQRFAKVIKLTAKGCKEIDNPKLHKKKLGNNFRLYETEITDQDKQIFESFGEYLSFYNNEQKKSIISNSKNILCIAGAGSGKTTVLTKRIEFLIKYKSIDPKKILAITFTKKAKEEMKERLNSPLTVNVQVDTFNSFCERNLRIHNNLIYDRQVNVLSYRDRFKIMNKALKILSITIDKAINTYFTTNQRNGKTPEQLANVFMNDCFFIRDYYKFKNQKIEINLFELNTQEEKKTAQMVISIANYIEAYMKKNGLRNFADQLLDTITLYNNNKEIIPEFEHVLIDEYQDVNSTQIKLIDIINPDSVFCVGDPRQSIYGWRGSDIRYILNFEDKYNDAEIITLKKNYRSTKHIVELSNIAIKGMKLPDLESNLEGNKNIKLKNFDSEYYEFEYIVEEIKDNIKQGLNDKLFILARTNRLLKEISEKLKKERIKHNIKTDDTNQTHSQTNSNSNEKIILATIHAIKGLEAEKVFIVGCSGNYFPCIGSDHPIVDLVKVEEYDKEEEERRLFYVAISRAKNDLTLTYSTKKPTYFITKEMLNIFNNKTPNDYKDYLTNLMKKTKNTTSFKIDSNKSKINKNPSTPKVISDPDKSTLEKLKEWRRNESQKINQPAFYVLHDKTINEIASVLPKTKFELGEIKGMGPAKISKYGEKILKIIKRN